MCSNKPKDCCPENKGGFEFEPYMLGSCYGVGLVEPPTDNNGGNSFNDCPEVDSVRNALRWDETLCSPGLCDRQYNFNRNKKVGSSWVSPPGCLTLRSSRSMQAAPPVAPMKQNKGNWCHPCAHISGQGERVPIPFQVAPSGTNPASLLQEMEPVTVKVTVPRPACNNGEPLRFTIDPASIYGNLFKQ